MKFMLQFYQETIWVSWQAGSVHCTLLTGPQVPRAVSLRAVLPAPPPPQRQAGSLGALLIAYKMSQQGAFTMSPPTKTAQLRPEWGQLPRLFRFPNRRLPVYLPPQNMTQKYIRHHLHLVFSSASMDFRKWSQLRNNVAIPLCFSSRMWRHKTFQITAQETYTFRNAHMLTAVRLWEKQLISLKEEDRAQAEVGK